jgi:hypothetical protein
VKANGDIRINPPTAYHWKVFWGGKLFFFLYRFVLPVCLTRSLVLPVGFKDGAIAALALSTGSRVK